jgi:small subunit ribosomal protein S16
MLKIRLQRVGRKHEPVFRLVLTDSKNSTKSGKFLEILGSYDSRRGDKAEFKTDRIADLVKTGAHLSTTVHNLLVDRKVISGKKLNSLPLKKAIVKEKTEEEKKAEAAASAPASNEADAPEVVAEATA